MLSPPASRYGVASMVSRSSPVSTARYSREPAAWGENVPASIRGPKRGAHELELDAGQHRRQDAALPAAWIAHDGLLRAARARPAPRVRHRAGPSQARAQAGGDGVEHEHRGCLGAALDGREHAAADATTVGECLQGQPRCARSSRNRWPRVPQIETARLPHAAPMED